MPDQKLTGGFDLGFQEQIDFFRQKLNLPTAAWDDIWQSAHDRAFVVAGATKADLLDDLRQAVDKAITEGTTLETFRRDFRKIVADRGWHGWTGEDRTGGEAWRTKVIYETNLRTTYAAGREAQLSDPGLQKLLPYRRYVHNDSVLHPRPQHLAWNGLTLPHDHPFWKTHSPPNGWGCRCRVTAVAAPRKGDPTTPPEGWDEISEKTGVPVGIDKGWAYAPGQSHVDELRALVKSKVATLPDLLGNALAADVAALFDNAGMKIESFAREALSVADRKIELSLGAVTIAERIQQDTGFNVTGFERVIDNYGIRHTIKRHGNQATEDARGQIAVTLADFDLIPLITSSPDRVFADGKNKIGRDVIVFTKIIDGVGYRHVEEIRPKGKLVATDSLRKKKGAWGS